MEAVIRPVQIARSVHHGDCVCFICGRRIAPDELRYELKQKSLHKDCAPAEYTPLFRFLGYEAVTKEETACQT